MFLNSPRKKFFILGAPGVGKTTLVEYLFDFLKNNLSSFNFSGFLTTEIREGAERKGFKIKVLNSDTESILAIRKDLIDPKEIKDKPFVGKYVVKIENLEKVVENLEKESEKENVIFIIDEIGKMEIFSLKFRKFIEKLLISPVYLLATVGKGEDPFLKKLIDFEPAFLCEVTKENRDFLRNRLKFEFSRKGKLIAIEGIDGAGKTTFAKALYETLKKRGINCIFSCEPTSGPFGEKIKSALIKKESNPQDLRLLFLKDRKWHVEKIILPALEAQKWIILDRYYPSTLAYQSSQGLPLKELLIENETIAPIPDLVIYLDLPLEVAFKRIGNREKRLTIFEKREFLERVTETYKKCLKLFNYLIIDATKPVEENLEYLLKFLDSKFKGSLS
jgi:dTMP kinase|uniref:Thymidylate kinase n=1 Tax=Thermodesulfobacterium geofontis TaxID=1295609 RepID=A0A7V5K4C9_9BACT